MSKPSVSSEAVAQDQLRSYFERWQRLEEEKRAISDDLKELFAEAKGFGFDTKVMRKLFRDETGDYSERMEFEAIYELYATALGTRNANARDAREADVDQGIDRRSPTPQAAGSNPAVSTNPTPPASQETTAADPAEGVIASSAEPFSEIPSTGVVSPEASSLNEAGARANRGGEDVTASPALMNDENIDEDDKGRADAQALGSAVESGARNSEPVEGEQGEMPRTAAAPVAEGVSPNASSVTPFLAITAGGRVIRHQGEVA